MASRRRLRTAHANYGGQSGLEVPYTAELSLFLEGHWPLSGRRAGLASGLHPTAPRHQSGGRPHARRQKAEVRLFHSELPELAVGHVATGLGVAEDGRGSPRSRACRRGRRVRPASSRTRWRTHGGGGRSRWARCSGACVSGGRSPRPPAAGRPPPRPRRSRRSPRTGPGGCRAGAVVREASRRGGSRRGTAMHPMSTEHSVSGIHAPTAWCSTDGSQYASSWCQ